MESHLKFQFGDKRRSIRMKEKREAVAKRSKDIDEKCRCVAHHFVQIIYTNEI